MYLITYFCERDDDDKTYYGHAIHENPVDWLLTCCQCYTAETYFIINTEKLTEEQAALMRKQDIKGI